MLINLTPHDINVIHADGSTTTIPSTGVARLEAEFVPYYANNTVMVGDKPVPVGRIKFSAPFGLPVAREGVYLIVSQLLAQFVGRADLLWPAETVRDERGNVIGCRAFGRSC